MQNARYFRDQAILCLELARHISDPDAAEKLRASAASYFSRATDLEQVEDRRSEVEDGREGSSSPRLSSEK